MRELHVYRKHLGEKGRLRILKEMQEVGESSKFRAYFKGDPTFHATPSTSLSSWFFARLPGVLREERVLAGGRKAPIFTWSKPGQSIGLHNDMTPGLGKGSLAWCYYVDVACEGGLLVFPGVVSVVPQNDTLVVFEVSRDSLHQVTRVRSGRRLVMAGWLVKSKRQEAHVLPRR